MAPFLFTVKPEPNKKKKKLQTNKLADATTIRPEREERGFAPAATVPKNLEILLSSLENYRRKKHKQKQEQREIQETEMD